MRCIWLTSLRCWTISMPMSPMKDSVLRKTFTYESQPAFRDNRLLESCYAQYLSQTSHQVGRADFLCLRVDRNICNGGAVRFIGFFV